MSEWYEELGEIMGTLDAYETELECMILNGKNKKANHYLDEASAKIKQASSYLSEAIFELSTSNSIDES